MIAVFNFTRNLTEHAERGELFAVDPRPPGPGQMECVPHKVRSKNLPWTDDHRVLVVAMDDRQALRMVRAKVFLEPVPQMWTEGEVALTG